MSDCTCPKNHDASGFTSGLLLGLILGAAGIHFLSSSEDGKEILKRLKENTSEALKDIGENPAFAEKIQDLQKTMDAARATINTAAERVAEATETVKPSPKKNFFQKMGASLGK